MFWSSIGEGKQISTDDDDSWGVDCFHGERTKALEQKSPILNAGFHMIAHPCLNLADFTQNGSNTS